MLVCCLIWLGACPSAGAQRVLGLDVSAWQGNISQTSWNTLHTTNARDFAFIRSSRGGTTGFYNQSDPDNSDGLNTLSQRYDDPYFVQNITRATAAGMFAGPYHFARPDVVASTTNSGGIANTGVDEANHFLQMAGPWMRPGYLLPVFDLEAGQAERTSAQLTQFSIDFSNRILEVTGVRPIIYTNGNYANYVQSSIVDAFPILWSARWPNQANPDAIPVQTGHPKDSSSTIYGPWDNAPRPTHPWQFWQYASTARLSGFNNGASNLDVNVAQGGIEFLKDQLVPALWTTNSSGQWTDLANWNSGQTPTAPVQGPGQVARVGTLTLPAVRLPGANDTVILERSAGAPTITLSSGAHTIRKLVVREALNITGGTLTVGYVPTSDSTPLSAQFSAPVSLSGTGSLSAHTLQVDASQTLTFGGGSLTLNRLDLASHAAIPGALLINGDVGFNPLSSATATIRSSGAGASAGVVHLGDSDRAWTVGDGTAAVDLLVEAQVTAGGLTKQGPGTLKLTGNNAYAGGTRVEAGTLYVSNSAGSGTGAGGVEVAAGGVLGGNGSISGSVSVAGALSPGESIGGLTVGGLDLTDGGSLVVEIANPASFDTLTVNGPLTLAPGATLDVRRLGGFQPTFGQQIVIVSGASSRTGEFATVVNSPGGPGYGVRYAGPDVVLEALSGLQGDFDNNGTVDAADYTLWRDNLGAPVISLMNAGGAGVVDSQLYDQWRANFGATGAVAFSATAVPEPTGSAAMILAVLSGAVLAAARRIG